MMPVALYVRGICPSENDAACYGMTGHETAWSHTSVHFPLSTTKEQLIGKIQSTIKIHDELGDCSCGPEGIAFEAMERCVAQLRSWGPPRTVTGASEWWWSAVSNQSCAARQRRLSAISKDTMRGNVPVKSGGVASRCLDSRLAVLFFPLAHKCRVHAIN
jgi:hypothetical protein